MNGVKAPGGTMGLIGDEMQRDGLYGVGDGQCVGMNTCLHASVCASYLCHQSLFNDAIAVWPYSTYICILAPTTCVLMMTFVIYVHEEAAWTSRMTRLCLLHLCAMCKLQIQSMISIVASHTKSTITDGRIGPNGNGVVE